MGILTPNWLANATYLGSETVDAKPCDVWTKSDGFIKYWADQASGDPVRWIFFDGMQVRTLHGEPTLARGISIRWGFHYWDACPGKRPPPESSVSRR